MNIVVAIAVSRTRTRARARARTRTRTSPVGGRARGRKGSYSEDVLVLNLTRANHHNDTNRGDTFNHNEDDYIKKS